jgi:hypothetical protein
MSQKDFLENQVIEEILREKSSYYMVQNKVPDYWILISPKFLTENNLENKIRKTRFYKNQKSKIVFKSNDSSEIEFYASLVSSDKEFMNWIKLRLGYFEEINDFQNEKESSSYVSDGICGNYLAESTTDDSFLLDNINFVHPDIIQSKISNSVKSFY